jgi:hypothetical protein
MPKRVTIEDELENATNNFDNMKISRDAEVRHRNLKKDDLFAALPSSLFAVKRPGSDYGREQDWGKRVKGYDEDMASSIESAVNRTCIWLRRREQREPRTARKLCNAIRAISQEGVQVDAKIVYYHLLFNGILAWVDGQLKVFPAPAAILGLVCDGSSMDTFSDDFVLALRRCINWTKLCSNADLPKSEPALLRTLSQLCHLKRQVDAEDVYDSLVRKGLVSEENGQLLYSLGDKGVAHYAPYLEAQVGVEFLQRW